MHRTSIRSALSVLVLLILAGVGVAGASAQTQAPAQAVAPATARVPTPPPPPPDVAAPPADAQTTASGLTWKVLKPGTGTAHPEAADTVVINYNGWTTNGRIFDSTDMRGKPSTFPVGKIALPGMVEAIELLTVGEKARFWVPDKLAFNSAPGKPQGTCVFEIELLEIKAAPQLSAIAPPDVAAPPSDAQVTKSGLASKVIQAGTGKTHPKADTTVAVQYVGWTPDGKMFDANNLYSTPLNKVIAGWTEGVQLMVEGEHRRFWIPGDLAYDKLNVPNAPKGMLVFDVVLVKIQ